MAWAWALWPPNPQLCGETLHRSFIVRSFEIQDQLMIPSNHAIRLNAPIDLSEALDPG